MSRRVSTRTGNDPILLSAPRGLTGQTFDIDGKRYAALTYSRPALWAAALTSAEYEVAMMLVAGRTSAEIAAARYVSLRTVANQVSSVFRKVGVKSRSELVVRLEP